MAHREEHGEAQGDDHPQDRGEGHGEHRLGARQPDDHQPEAQQPDDHRPEAQQPEAHREPGGNRSRDEVARAVRGGPAGPDGTAPSGQGEQPDEAARQGFDRQRLEPQDGPPADVADRGNIAGEKDFELQPPAS
jgi:hypothetical protein